ARRTRLPDHRQHARGPPEADRCPGQPVDRGWQEGEFEGVTSFLPSEAGEVSPSYGDGGVKGISRGAHDPSVRFADTSPTRSVGEEGCISPPSPDRWRGGTWSLPLPACCSPRAPSG